MLPLQGLSSASGKSVVGKFYGGLLSSDGGVLRCAKSNSGFGSRSGWPRAWLILGRRSRSPTAWRISFALGC